MKQGVLTLWFFVIACAGLHAGGPAPYDPGDPAPVPEPGSIVLLGTAAGGIGYAVWRRNRNQSE